MLIHIGKDGVKKLSVTKSERKKLTDALEHLALLQEHGVADTEEARSKIHEVIAKVDDAIANGFGAVKREPLPGQQTLPGVTDEPQPPAPQG